MVGYHSEVSMEPEEQYYSAYPRVTINVQIPIFVPLSFAKKVSVTVALLIAMAGLMKKATRILVTI